jgi:hypothetical protein
MNGQLRAPAALPAGKEPMYPLDTRLGGPQNRLERYGKVKILYPYRDSDSDPLVVEPVASR